MLSETNKLWIASGRDGMFSWTSEPTKTDGCWNGTGQPMTADPLSHLVPPGECREYVLIPADQYSQPTTDLSPVAKLIAELATQLLTHGDYEYFSIACEDAAKIIAAAREIESEAK